MTQLKVVGDASIALTSQVTKQKWLSKTSSAWMNILVKIMPDGENGMLDCPDWAFISLSEDQSEVIKKVQALLKDTSQSSMSVDMLPNVIRYLDDKGNEHAGGQMAYLVKIVVWKDTISFQDCSKHCHEPVFSLDVDIEPYQEPSARESIMTFMRSNELADTLTLDDRMEIFSAMPVGASDLTVALFNGLLEDYDSPLRVKEACTLIAK